MDVYDYIDNIIAEGKLWKLPIGKGKKKGWRFGVPVDAEKEWNKLGLSAGFIHLKDPNTGVATVSCGVFYFQDNAVCLGDS